MMSWIKKTSCFGNLLGISHSFKRKCNIPRTQILFLSTSSEASSSSNGQSDNSALTLDHLKRDLRHWRNQVAGELQVPIFRVLPNNVLETIAERRPRDKEQLSLLPGIGNVTLFRFGTSILRILDKYKHLQFEANKYNIDPNEIVETDLFWENAKLKKKPKKKTEKKPKKSKAASSSLPTLSTEEAQQLELISYSFEQLNSEQKVAAKLILSGNNVFLTGNAGTGKSFVLKYIIQEFSKLHGSEKIAVTAPTGIAAINICGQTIHSFAGIKLGIIPFYFISIIISLSFFFFFFPLIANNINPISLYSKVKKDASAVERWKNCKVLIIDEISMLNIELFEALDFIARTIRENDSPFGGIQIIAVGDFAQLPPVVKERDNLKFCFESPLWEACGFGTEKGTVYLETVERQVDNEFVNYLNQIRLGYYSREFDEKLNTCLVENKSLPEDGIIPTKLYALNKQVDDENQFRLNEIPSKSFIFEAKDAWAKKVNNDYSKEKFMLQMLDEMIPKKIELKVGAQVMLLRNRSRMTFAGAIKSTGPNLVNGSRGKVIAINPSLVHPNTFVPTVQFDNGIITTIGPVEYTYSSSDSSDIIVREQIPLKLAWLAIY